MCFEPHQPARFDGPDLDLDVLVNQVHEPAGYKSHSCGNSLVRT